MSYFTLSFLLYYIFLTLARRILQFFINLCYENAAFGDESFTWQNFQQRAVLVLPAMQCDFRNKIEKHSRSIDWERRNRDIYAGVLANSSESQSSIA